MIKMLQISSDVTWFIFVF